MYFEVIRYFEYIVLLALIFPSKSNEEELRQCCRDFVTGEPGNSRQCPFYCNEKDKRKRIMYLLR